MQVLAGQYCQGKTFNTENETGKFIWDQVSERLNRQAIPDIQTEPTAVAVRERYGDPYLIRPSLGQGAFRVLVTEAYERRCAITVACETCTCSLRTNFAQ